MTPAPLAARLEQIRDAHQPVRDVDFDTGEPVVGCTCGVAAEDCEVLVLLAALATVAVEAERATWEEAAVVLDELERTTRAIARDHEDHSGHEGSGEFFWQRAKAFQAGAAALRAAAEEAEK